MNKENTRESKQRNDISGSNRRLCAGLGEVLWDVYEEAAYFGGAPANFACHAAALGCQAAIASRVGNDDFGRNAFHELSRRNVTTDCLQVCQERLTGCVNVELDEHGQPNYQFQDGAAWDFLEWNSDYERLASSCDVVCFGTLAQRNFVSRHTITKFLKAVKPSCLSVFDVNFRQDFYSHEIIRNSLELTSVLKLNEHELPIVCRAIGLETPGVESSIKEIATIYGLQLIALTKGKNGAILFSEGDFSYYAPTEKTEIRDTVGAGDAFTAATIWGLINGYSLNQINSFANKLAGYVCSQKGATPTLAPNTIDRMLPKA